jgi:hypothetical protein
MPNANIAQSPYITIPQCVNKGPATRAARIAMHGCTKHGIPAFAHKKKGKSALLLNLASFTPGHLPLLLQHHFLILTFK